MFGIKFEKAPPTAYVIHYQNGRVYRQGTGLSFWYFAPISVVLEIPLVSSDVPFVFHEMTEDFQEVTLQGQLTYRVVDPVRVSQMIDFGSGTVSSAKGGLEDKPEDVLAQRLINATQVLARGITQRLPLPTVLGASHDIGQQVLAALRASDITAMLGLEVLSLSLLSIKPTPEMSKALEAAAREALQRQSDQAIYERRNAAVEEERRIKESELSTENAVETKRRQIRETKMAADISLEEQRATLIELKVANEKKDSDSRAYALESSLKPLRDADWRTLMAVAAKGGDPRFAISLAFHELAENAAKIGQLNVTPDLLKSLISNVPEK